MTPFHASLNNYIGPEALWYLAEEVNGPIWTQNPFFAEFIEPRSSSMMKRGHIAGLRLLALEMPTYKVGPWLASWNLDFRRILIIPRTDISGSPQLNYL